MTKRRLGRGLSFLILLVTVMFAARELPEFLSLADDVSNDGELLELVRHDRTSHLPFSDEQAAPFSFFLAAPLNLPSASASHSPPVLPFGAGQDILRLLSLQRV